MNNRKRKNRRQFWTTDEEDKAIDDKMAQIGITNFGAFARRMLIGGVVVNPVIPELVEANAQMSRIGNNINQATRRINASNVPAKRDIEIIRKEVHEIWLLLKSIESTQP